MTPRKFFSCMLSADTLRRGGLGGRGDNEEDEKCAQGASRSQSTSSTTVALGKRWGLRARPLTSTSSPLIGDNTQDHVLVIQDRLSGGTRGRGAKRGILRMPCVRGDFSGPGDVRCAL